MANNHDLSRMDIPDFVLSAEAAIAAGESLLPDPSEEVTIKFGKGLVGEPFISKSGKELVEVKIPNPDPEDHRPWESFVISPKMIHENQFGKGVWMKLPAENKVNLSRNVEDGIDASGKKQWKRETRSVTVEELKGLLEAYKTRSKESVLGKLTEKKETVAAAPKKAAQRTKKQENSL